MKAKFEGLKQFQEEIKRSYGVKRQELRRLVATTSIELISEVKNKITENKSVITGNLRASITTLSTSLDGLGVEVGTNVNYAENVDNRKPFWGSAVDKAKENFQNKVKLIIN